MEFKSGHYFWKADPKHYFECAPPPLIGESIWQYHFALPLLKCNQVGSLVWDEEGYEIVEYRPKHKVSHGYCQVQMWDLTQNKNGRGANGRPLNKYSPMIDEWFCGKGRLTSKANLIWEIRNGCKLSKGRLVHVNSNPMDFREENLMVFSGKGMTDWRRSNLAFLRETARQMVRRESRAERYNMDPLEYFRDILLMPKVYLDVYEKNKKTS